MYSIPLSLSYISLLLALIVLLIAGVVQLVELFRGTYPTFVTDVNVPVVTALYHTVRLAAIIYCVIVILHLVIGGVINAV